MPSFRTLRQVAEPVIEQTFQIVAGPKALVDLSFYANGNTTFVCHRFEQLAFDDLFLVMPIEENLSEASILAGQPHDNLSFSKRPIPSPIPRSKAAMSGKADTFEITRDSGYPVLSAIAF